MNTIDMPVPSACAAQSKRLSACAMHRRRVILTCDGQSCHAFCVHAHETSVKQGRMAFWVQTVANAAANRSCLGTLALSGQMQRSETRTHGAMPLRRTWLKCDGNTNELCIPAEVRHLKKRLSDFWRGEQWFVVA